MVKKIILLANSRKISGRCLAGKDFADKNKWLRPISERPSEEISEEERRYENGFMPNLLDIIQICFKNESPKLFQKENIIIDDKYYWEKKGEFSISDLKSLCDNPNELWINNFDKGYNYKNNCITEQDANLLNNSLYLITPQTLSLIVEKEWPDEKYSKRKVKAKFEFNNIVYIIAVTDPIIEKKYLGLNDGIYKISNPENNIFMCVSLSLPFENFCYKLIASIIGASII